ncbi:MAG TPA: hypothetical protein DEB10_10080 [Ruminococcaceae bacterium]|jgi:anti-sigma28 factor (negative regulator of flagellin synthesis)|nr:hypothetical protein [Oscillospiraceae bacterium]
MTENVYVKRWARRMYGADFLRKPVRHFIQSVKGMVSMKIDPNKVARIYEIRSSSVNRKSAVDKNTAAKKYSGEKNDRIEISDNGVKHGEVLTYKKVLVKEAERSANEGRIQMLKDKISRGEYHVPSSNIAEAILKTKL